MTLRPMISGWAFPTRVASSTLTLHLLVEKLRAAAKAQGLTPVVYEDGIYDRVDYGAHMTGKPTFHAFYEPIVMNGKSYPKAAGAADFNIAGGGSREAAWIRNTGVPLARKFGIAYHCEGMGASNQHLHLDVGNCANDGAGWYRASWIGRVAAAGVAAATAAVKSKLAVDGVLGPNTFRLWQGYYKARGRVSVVDGIESHPSSLIREVQTDLRKEGTYRGPVDGFRGPNTNAALLAHFRRTRYYQSRDGANWVYALQRQLNA